MKEEIIRLHNEGKSYNEIIEITGAAKSTIAYHCSKKYRLTHREYNLQKRKDQMIELKKLHGNKCSICGYDRCSTSLHFHHKDPKKKSKSISDMLRTSGIKHVMKELTKCVLVCSNCHGEIHEGLITI